jgi:hypothetical protein
MKLQRRTSNLDPLNVHTMPHGHYTWVVERSQSFSVRLRTEIIMASDKRFSKRWRDEHESLMLKICTKTENRPTGGPTDGKMAYAKELWQRVHIECMAELPHLNSTLQ